VRVETISKKKKIEKSKSLPRAYKNNKAKNWSEEKLTAKTEKLCSELVVEYSRDYTLLLLISFSLCYTFKKVKRRVNKI